MVNLRRVVNFCSIAHFERQRKYVARRKECFVPCNYTNALITTMTHKLGDTPKHHRVHVFHVQWWDLWHLHVGSTLGSPKRRTGAFQAKAAFEGNAAPASTTLDETSSLCGVRGMKSALFVGPRHVGHLKLHISLGLLAHILRRWLDPQNPPQPSSQEVVGALGYINMVNL